MFFKTLVRYGTPSLHFRLRLLIQNRILAGRGLGEASATTTPCHALRLLAPKPSTINPPTLARTRSCHPPLRSLVFPTPHRSVSPLFRRHSNYVPDSTSHRKIASAYLRNRQFTHSRVRQLTHSLGAHQATLVSSPGNLPRVIPTYRDRAKANPSRSTIRKPKRSFSMPARSPSTIWSRRSGGCTHRRLSLSCATT